MEQRILPPELENKPKLTPRGQTLAALTFAVLVLTLVALVVWFQS